MPTFDPTTGRYTNIAMGAPPTLSPSAQVQQDVGLSHIANTGATQDQVANIGAVGGANRANAQGDFNQNVGNFNTFMSQPSVQPFLQPNTSTTNLFSRFQGGGVGGGRAASPSIALPTAQIQAGSSAAFSRAKDQVGETANSVIQGLNRALAARGITAGGGGSIAANALENIYNAGEGQLADVSRANAINEAGTATDLAKTGYEGAIVQRGQDVNAATAEDALAERAAEAQTNAQLAQSTRQQQALSGLVQAFKGLY